MGRKPKSSVNVPLPISTSPHRKLFPSLYPLWLDLHGVQVLVIGGGTVAERKVKSLLTCGARIRLVSPTLSPGLQRLHRRKRFVFRKGGYRPSDLRRARIVFAATDQAARNAAIADQANRAGIWANNATASDRSNALVPSVIRRGELTIAISSGGLSPALSKRIRIEIERFLGRGFSDYARFLGRARSLILAGVGREAERRKLFSRLISPAQFELIRSGRLRLAKARAKQILSRMRLNRSVRK